MLNGWGNLFSGKAVMKYSGGSTMFSAPIVWLIERRLNIFIQLWFAFSSIVIIQSAKPCSCFLPNLPLTVWGQWNFREWARVVFFKIPELKSFAKCLHCNSVTSLQPTFDLAFLCGRRDGELSSPLPGHLEDRSPRLGAGDWAGTKCHLLFWFRPQPVFPGQSQHPLTGLCAFTHSPYSLFPWIIILLNRYDCFIY